MLMFLNEEKHDRKTHFTVLLGKKQKNSHITFKIAYDFQNVHYLNYLQPVRISDVGSSSPACVSSSSGTQWL